MTNLIIQILTEEDAKILKDKIFGDLAKVVKGYYSGTYGLMIPFPLWLDCSSTISKFLYGKSQIELRPEELMYYEFDQGWDHCEEVDFSELFPKAGFYSFDKEGLVKLQQNIGRIYYRNNHICSVNDTSVIGYWIERDPIFKSGISKMYRRGFIDKETKYKWINELYPDILQDC